ncbi:MAG: endonuclease/exonuclease/phosphatase family protein [Bryobacteraceae bacterium]|nr:endonuclease/exonuclease/phosphatase family protein [Bryobacteraceae bacterium]
MPQHFDISVVTLNVAKETNVDRMLRDLRRSPATADADIYLFQEAVGGNGAGAVAEHLAALLGYHVAAVPASPAVTDQGLAILSRYPLTDVRTIQLKACNLVFRSRTRIAIAATVDAPGAAIRVWNAHLDTRINPVDRLEQLRPVLEEAAHFSGPRLIAGDLNTNPFYWIGNVIPFPCFGKQAGAVQQLMNEHGFSTPVGANRATHDALGMRLDWLFFQGLESNHLEVAPIPFSDHRAVAANLVLNGRGSGESLR